jgi:hypothetical protein
MDTVYLLPELLRRSRNDLPVFFSFASRRAVQSQSPQAPRLGAVLVAALRAAWASCTLTSRFHYLLAGSETPCARAS